MKACRAVGAPGSVTNTGIHPGGIAPVAPVPVVVSVVVLPEAVATIGVSARFCWWNSRIAAALADVAIASEAKPAIASLISLECTVLLLLL